MEMVWGKNQNQTRQGSLVKVVKVDVFSSSVQSWRRLFLMLELAISKHHRFHLSSKLYHCKGKLCHFPFYALIYASLLNRFQYQPPLDRFYYFRKHFYSLNFWKNQQFFSFYYDIREIRDRSSRPEVFYKKWCS